MMRGPRNSRCFLFLRFFISFLLASCESVEVSSTNPGEDRSRHGMIENLSNAVPFPRKIITNAQSRNNESETTSSRSLQMKSVLLKNIKIWFKGMPSSLDVVARRSFEGSTAMSLVESMVKNNYYVDTKFSMTVEIVRQGKGFFLCNLEIILEKQTTSSLTQMELKYKDMIEHSFNDASFVKSYIRVLKLSSLAFEYVTDASLTSWVRTPSPTIAQLKFEFDGIMLEYYGVAKLNQVDKYLLQIVTEGFLINMFKVVLGYDVLEQLTLNFSYTDSEFSNKFRAFAQVTIYARSTFNTHMTNQDLKNIMVSIFVERKAAYLNTLNSLGKNINEYQISILSHAPSTIPSSENPSKTPTLSPSRPFSLVPSIYPSSSPSAAPSLNPFSNPSIVPSLFRSNSPSEAPSDTMTTNPSTIPSNRRSISPVLSPSQIPTYFPSSSFSNAPSTVPSHHLSTSPGSSPSHTPSYSLSFSPYFTPSKHPSSKPILFPSMNPTEVTGVPTVSSLPSNRHSEKPTGYPTMSPTPCLDDETYRSRYGSPCQVHSESRCNLMKQVGFTVEEVDELIMRCKKSCDACWYSSTPSSIPSIEHEIISVNIPSEVTNSIPNSYPSISPSIYAVIISTTDLISTKVVEDGIVEVNPTNNMAIPMIVGVVLIGFLVLGFLIKRRPRTKTPEINASGINIKSQNIAHDSYFQNEEDYQDRSEGDLEFSRDDTLYSLVEVKLGLTNEVNIESINRSSVSKPLSPVRSVMNNKKISDVTVDTEVSSFEKNTDDSYSSNYDERYSLDSKHTDSKDTSRENSSMKSSVIEMKETESKSQTGVLDDNQKDSLLSMLNDTIKYMPSVLSQSQQSEIVDKHNFVLPDTIVLENSQNDASFTLLPDMDSPAGSIELEKIDNIEETELNPKNDKSNPASIRTMINDTMKYMQSPNQSSESDGILQNSLPEADALENSQQDITLSLGKDSDSPNVSTELKESYNNDDTDLFRNHESHPTPFKEIDNKTVEYALSVLSSNQGKEKDGKQEELPANAKVVEKSQRDSTLSVMADSGNNFSVAAEEMCNTEDGSYLEIREPHPTSLMTIINDTMKYMPSIDDVKSRANIHTVSPSTKKKEPSFKNVEEHSLKSKVMHQNEIITKSQSDILPSNNSQSIVEDRDEFSSVTDFVFNLKKKCTKSFSTIHSGTTGVLSVSTKADNDFKSSPTIASDSQLVILNAALNCLNSAGELTSSTDTIETVIEEDRRIYIIENHHRLLGKISEEKLNSSNLQRSSSTISCRGKGKGSSTILRSPSLNETVKNDPFSCIEMDNFSSLRDTCNLNDFGEHRGKYRAPTAREISFKLISSQEEKVQHMESTTSARDKTEAFLSLREMYDKLSATTTGSAILNTSPPTVFDISDLRQNLKKNDLSSSISDERQNSKKNYLSVNKKKMSITSSNLSSGQIENTNQIMESEKNSEVPSTNKKINLTSTSLSSLSTGSLNNSISSKIKNEFPAIRKKHSNLSIVSNHSSSPKNKNGELSLIRKKNSNLSTVSSNHSMNSKNRNVELKKKNSNLLRGSSSHSISSKNNNAELSSKKKSSKLSQSHSNMSGSSAIISSE